MTIAIARPTTASEIMKAAHANARFYRSLNSMSYRECLRKGLRDVYKELRQPKAININDLCAEIKRIDPRFSTYAEGDFVHGCFRGKGSEAYIYKFSERSFRKNTCGGKAENVFAQAIENLSK